MLVDDPECQTDIQRGAGRLRETGSPKRLPAINVMTEHIESPLTRFELADRVSVSERTLNRTFQRELGMTSGWYDKLFRLQRARHMALETL
jgi:AraC family carnitine catabolism transcriptional activator